MKCKNCQEHLPVMLDGELDSDLAREVEEHLDGCEACADQRALLEQGLEGLDALPQLEPSAGFDAAFARKLQDAQREQRLAEDEEHHSKPSWWQVWRLPVLATAGACAALLAVALMRDPPAPTTSAPAPNEPVPVAELVRNLPLLQDYDVVTRLDALEDFEVISRLDTLEEEL